MGSSASTSVLRRAREILNGLARCFAAHGKVRNEGVPIIVPSSLHSRRILRLHPCGLETQHRFLGIRRLRLAEREQIPLGAALAELRQILMRVIHERRDRFGVQRDGSPFGSLRLAIADGQDALLQVDAAPLQTPESASRSPQ